MEPELVRVMVGSSTEGKLFTQDALKIGSELWIVPAWTQSLDGQWMTPDIAIRVDPLGVQKMSPGFPAELLLNGPVPTAALQGDGRSARDAGLQVEDGPVTRMRIRIPTVQ